MTLYELCKFVLNVILSVNQICLQQFRVIHDHLTPPQLTPYAPPQLTPYAPPQLTPYAPPQLTL